MQRRERLVHARAVARLQGGKRQPQRIGFFGLARLHGQRPGVCGAQSLCGTRRARKAFSGDFTANGRNAARATHAQLPAMVTESTRIEPVRMLPRASTSLPTATIARNMSRRLPAMVISSTG